MSKKSNDPPYTQKSQQEVNIDISKNQTERTDHWHHNEKEKKKKSINNGLKEINSAKSSNFSRAHFQSMGLKNQKNCYVNFSSPSNFSVLSRSVFPYCIDERPEVKEGPQKKINITNLIRQNDESHLDFLPMKQQFIENEQPPVNEYLSYELSKQINSGLYEVKVLAQQIKNIKRDKQKHVEDKQNFKPKNKIGIKSVKQKFQKNKDKALRTVRL